MRPSVFKLLLQAATAGAETVAVSERDQLTRDQLARDQLARDQLVLHREESAAGDLKNRISEQAQGLFCRLQSLTISVNVVNKAESLDR